MPKISTVTFTGKSGNEYTFDVYDADTPWKDNVAAVYVVTRRYKGEDGKFYHAKIYIGRTDDLKDRFSNHHQQDCFDRNNATCICIYLETNESRRAAIETDLMQGNRTKCNEP